MNKKLLLGAFIAIVLAFNISHSDAFTIGFNPISQVVPTGSSFTVDLFISGLGDGTAPSLSTFDLDISYDPTILTLTNYALGPYLGDISLVEAWDLSWGETAPGSVNVAELSFLFDSELDILQPGSFALASLAFDTLALGTSPLSLSINALGDASGASLSAAIHDGSVSAVPEPATLFLLGTGLIGLRYLRKRI